MANVHINVTECEENWGIKAFSNNWKCFLQQTKPFSVKMFSCLHTHTVPEGCFIMVNGFLVSPSVLQEVGIVVMNFSIVR